MDSSSRRPGRCAIPQHEEASVFRRKEHSGRLDQIVRLETGGACSRGCGTVRCGQDLGVNGGAAAVHRQFFQGSRSSGGLVPEDPAFQRHMVAGQSGGVPVCGADRGWQLTRREPAESRKAKLHKRRDHQQGAHQLHAVARRQGLR